MEKLISGKITLGTIDEFLYDDVCSHDTENGIIECLDGESDSCVRIVELEGKSEQLVTDTPDSPSPQFPSDINSNGDSGKLSIVSSVGRRNLIPNTNQGKTGWGWGKENGTAELTDIDTFGVNACKIKCVEASTGYQMLVHNLNLKSLKPNTKYTISFNVYTNIDFDIVFWITRLNNTGNFTDTYSQHCAASSWTKVQGSLTSYSVSLDSQSLYMTGMNKTGIELTISNLQMVEGDKIGTWTPAPEDITLDNAAQFQDIISTATIPLSEPLHSLPDGTHDILECIDGVWGITRNVGKLIENGNHNFDIYPSGSNNLYNCFYHTLSLIDYTSIKHCLCTHFQSSLNAWDEEKVSITYQEAKSNGYAYVWIKVKNIDYPDTVSFNNFILSQNNNGTPVSILYVLYNPVFEPLSQEASKQLNNLLSYSPNNFIYTTDSLATNFSVSQKSRAFYENFKLLEEIKNTNTSLTDLDDELKSSFYDGIINTNEAEAIRKSAETMQVQITNQWGQINLNPSLIGTPKSNLQIKYNDCSNAYTVLMVAINTAIDYCSVDSTKTDAQKKISVSDMNTAFSTYKTKLADYQKAYQDAIDAITGKKAGDAAKDAVDGMEIGGRNLLLNSGNIITRTIDYFVVAYETSSLKLNTKYTFVFNGFTNSGNRLGVWFNNGNAGGYLFPSVNIPTTQYMTVTTPETLFTTDVHIYNYRQDTAQNATINWACMYEGEIKPPLDWTPAPEDAQSQIDSLDKLLASTTETTKESVLELDKINQKFGSEFWKTDVNNAISGTVQPQIDKANRGLNKWLVTVYDKYSLPAENQSKYDIDAFWGKNITPEKTVEIADIDLASKFTSNWEGDQKILYFVTFVYFDTAYSWTTTWYHDDGGTIYLNAKKVSEGGTYNYASITLPFQSGWNSIEVIINENTEWGGTEFSENLSALAQCKLMNCYFATITTRDTSIKDRYSGMLTTIDSITSRVSSTETNISKKADGTTVTALSNKVSENELSLNGFKTTVSETYTTKNDSSKSDSLNQALALMATGELVYTDPTFINGTNNVIVYNNFENGNVIVEHITKPNDCPTKSGYCLQIKCIALCLPGLGGFYQLIQSRANAKFIIKYLIKLPVNYCLVTATNHMGDGYTDKFITPTDGTGKWEIYVREIICGASGEFAIGGHVYVEGNTPTPTEPLIWYLGAIYCVDVTNASTVQEQITSVKTEAEQLADKFTWVVKSGTNESNMQLTDRALDVVAENINLKGLVTFSGLDNLTKDTINSAKAYTDAAKNHYGYQHYSDIVIYGDSDKYYPVIIKGGDQTIKREILINRNFSEQAPSEWYPDIPTHHGGLSLKLLTNFGGWGGARYSWYIANLEEEYCRMFAGAEFCLSYMGFTIFLRGGGNTGAVYHLYSDQSLTENIYDTLPDGNKIPPSPQICYDNNSWIGYLNAESNWKSYPCITAITSDVEKEIMLKKYTEAASNAVDNAVLTPSDKIGFLNTLNELQKINTRLTTSATNLNLTQEAEYISYVTVCNNLKLLLDAIVGDAIKQNTTTTTGWNKSDYDSKYDAYITSKENLEKRITDEVYKYASGEKGLNSENNKAIVNWCVNNNKAILNGEKLWLGSVHTDALAANSITADKIATDAIKSKSYTDASGVYSANGTFFNLADTGTIKSKNFAIDASGNAYFRGSVDATSGSFAGRITATSGYIGNGTAGFNISDYSLWSGLSTLNGSTNGIYIGTDGISLGGGKFKVTNDGNLYLDNALYLKSYDDISKKYIYKKTFYYDSSSTGNPDFLHFDSKLMLGILDVGDSLLSLNDMAEKLPNIYLQMRNENGFWGLAPQGNNNVWIRTTGQGIIPFQSGGAGSGHQMLGTSSWYFSAAYVDTIYERGTALSDKYSAASHEHKGINNSGYEWICNVNGKLLARKNEVYTPADIGASGADTCIGSLFYKGSLSKVSDRRSKKNINEIDTEEVLSLLTNLKIKTFNYKGDFNNLKNYGIIAQDLRDYLISNNKEIFSGLSINRNNDYGESVYDLNMPESEVNYSVDYVQFLPPLIVGFQYHEKEIINLKNELKNAKEIISTLSQQLENITLKLESVS